MQTLLFFSIERGASTGNNWKLINEIGEERFIDRIDDIELINDYLKPLEKVEVKSAINNAGGFLVWKNLANAGSDLASFVSKSLSDKLKHIDDI